MSYKRSIFNLYYDWWKNIDRFIFSLIILLFITGLFFSLVSTSLLVSDKLDTNDYAFFLKHLTFVFLGILIIFVLSTISEEKLFNLSPLIFIFSLITLFLVPIIGIEVNSAQRWIDLYFLPRFQPIELVKPFLIIMISLILSSEKYSNIYFKYLSSFLITLLIALLLAAQPDIGQTLLVFFSWSVLIFISGINIIFLTTSCLILSVILYFSINFFPKFEYIKNRILSFFNTESGTHNAQSEKAIEAITSGGYFGKGIGEGTLKNRVPEAHTDYIIAVIAEEFGSIISIFLVVIFLYIAFRIIKITVTETDKILKISLCGLSTLLIFQTFIHIGVNISLLPTTGMTLPFLSYGGSSLFGSAILAGVILNFTKNRFIENEIE